MEPASIAAIASIGSSLIGGLMGQDSARAAARANEQINRVNNETQREFAQHGVRWKVEDAARAGIHPLAALGAQTHSFAPQSIGASPDHSMSDAVDKMGQSLSYSIGNKQTMEEKQINALKIAALQADLEGKGISNQMALKQLQNMNAPAMPGATDNFMPGQGNSGMKVKPAERTQSAPGRPAQEMGWRPDVSYSRTDTGLTPMIPQGLSESLEDDVVGKLMWRIRNQLMPNVGIGQKPPKSMLPRGAKDWVWNHSRQEFTPMYPGDKYDKYEDAKSRYQKLWRGGY